MRRRHFIVATIMLGWIVALVPSCLEPTQITLDVRTDVRCDQAKGISISAGDQGSVQNAPPRLVSRDCSANGRIGTLVVTPESGNDADVAFRIVMGVDVPVEECTPERRNKGCIEQRRLVSYVAHTPIELPIDMLLICLGVVCDPASTCAANGKCVPARVNPEDCKPPKRCYPEGDPGAPPVIVPQDRDSSSATDGLVSTDAPNDGLVSSDAPNDTTGTIDAPNDTTGTVDAPNDTTGTVDAPNDAPTSQDASFDANPDQCVPEGGADAGMGLVPMAGGCAAAVP